MAQDQLCQIEVEAVRALPEWKAYLAKQVVTGAKQLAEKTASPNVVSIQHYRQSALTALQNLTKKIQESDSENGGQRAL